MSRALCLALALLLAGPSWGQVYTYLDANGNRVYTDQPRKGAQAVTLPPTNRLAPAPTAPSTPPPAAPKRAKRAVHYSLLRILAPEPDGTVSNGGGEVLVTVSSEPALQAGDAFELLLDDRATGALSQSPVLALHNVDRGAHKLAVRIVGSDGSTREQTAAQTFYVQRTSLAQRRRIHPCQEADWGVRPECPLADKPEDD